MVLGARAGGGALCAGRTHIAGWPLLLHPPALAITPPDAPPTLLQGQKFEYLLNTGNLVSRSGLHLSQSTGFTVVAEKLNFFRWVGCTGVETGCQHRSRVHAAALACLPACMPPRRP